MARVALYIRVSTEEQAVHGYSLDAQRTALEAWAKERGHTVQGLYADEGISARKSASKRPALQRLLVAVEGRQIDLVAFTKLDRWFRNVAEYYTVQPILEKYGVSWTAIQEDYSTDSAASRLKTNIMLSVSQDESDRIGERLRAIHADRRKKGNPIINKPPTGYLLAGGRLVKDPAKQAGLDAFFKSLIDNGGIQRAIRAAAAAGLPLTTDTARYIRDNPAYAGQFLGVDGMAEPYISMADFEAMRRPKSRPRATEQDRVYIFSGLIFCPICGLRYSGLPAYHIRKSGERVFTIRYQSKCRKRAAYGDCQNRISMREVDVEEYLLKAVSPAFQALRAQVATTGVQDSGATVEAAIRVERAKEQRLKELYLSGLYTLEELRAEKEAITRTITDMEAKKAAIATPPNLDGIADILSEDWEKLYKALSRIEKAAFWRRLLRRITISPEREIDFEFNFG